MKRWKIKPSSFSPFFFLFYFLSHQMSFVATLFGKKIARSQKRRRAIHVKSCSLWLQGFHPFTDALIRGWSRKIQQSLAKYTFIYILLSVDWDNFLNSLTQLCQPNDKTQILTDRLSDGPPRTFDRQWNVQVQSVLWK